MEVYINRKDGTQAAGEYNSETNALIVLKGSIVSSTVNRSEKFRGTATIERLREEYVKNGIVVEDVTFKSPSTAANFITGASSNGLTVWKDETGKKLKDVISK